MVLNSVTIPASGTWTCDGGPARQAAGRVNDAGAAMVCHRY